MLETGLQPISLRDAAQFKRVFRFDDTVDMLRKVRNKVGGHLDEDPEVGLTGLLQLLDDLSFPDALRFFKKLQAVFFANCRKVPWMGSYLAHGEVLRGVVGVVGPKEYVKPFDEHRQRQSPPKRTVQFDFSDAEAQRQLGTWLRSGGGSFEARDYFWNAFEHGRSVVERGKRGEFSYGLTTAHVAVLERFALASTSDRGLLLQLLSDCRRGFPEELAEIALRWLEQLHATDDYAWDGPICELLSGLPLRFDEPVRATLEAEAASESHTVACDALTALYIFMARGRSGPVVPRRPERAIYQPVLARLLCRVPPVFQVLTLVRCAAAFTDGTVVMDHQLHDEYAELQEVLRSKIEALLNGSALAAIGDLLKCHDYVSLSFFIADTLEQTGRADQSKPILEAVAHGHVHMTVHVDVRAQALQNLALASLRLGMMEQARNLAYHVMQTYPNDVILQLHAVAVLAEAEAPIPMCLDILEHVKRSYRLEPNETAEALRLTDLMRSHRSKTAVGSDHMSCG